MTSPGEVTPREFGARLQAVRTAKEIPLEAIADATKISMRVLSALEDGDFAKLPSHVFARMFVRQYLQLVDGPAELLASFERAWQFFVNSSQRFPIEPVKPNKGRRVGPWIVGIVLVVAALVAVLLVERRARTQSRATASPTPAVLLPLLAPTPSPSPTAAPEPTPAPAGELTVRTGPTKCWVSVRVAGEQPNSRLLAANSSWRLEGGGKAVDLVFGDGGAASVEYMGESHSPVGRGGEVVHLHLAGATPPARPAVP